MYPRIPGIDMVGGKGGSAAPETDPVFSASEAALFEAGDKDKLDDQSGVNTGDQDLSALEPSITHAITFTLPPSANAKAWLEVPWDCTITDWTITTDASGSCVLDLWNDTYGNYPPTIADTITASAKPTLSSAQKATSSTLTGWDTALSAGDYLLCNVDSASTATIIYLTLSVTRT